LLAARSSNPETGARDPVDGNRYLIVTADDYGIGPATSQGILDLAVQGRISATVLLVNSPHAEAAVRAWRLAGRPMELGWHPCLTLDKPVLPVQRVPSLVDPTGRFWTLGQLVRRLARGRIHAAEIEAELRAQHQRFQALTGFPPPLVNSHHHVQVFPAVGSALREVCGRHRPLPYMRRVREPWSVLARVPGARCKRLFLSTLGKRDARQQEQQGYPGNDWLIGVTDPPHVAHPDFLPRWLRRVPGEVVELTCHPGYLDTTLIGRDCTWQDGQLQRRVREFHMLQQASFRAACDWAGFIRVAPREWLKLGETHAA
jgi:predicted glycoside hydrolase/deacetylase ChbG (UPF0249 family)